MLNLLTTAAGKSYALVYLLAERLAASQPTFLQLAPDEFTYWCCDGICQFKISDRIWDLIANLDSDRDQEDISDELEIIATGIVPPRRVASDTYADADNLPSPSRSSDAMCIDADSAETSSFSIPLSEPYQLSDSSAYLFPANSWFLIDSNPLVESVHPRITYLAPHIVQAASARKQRINWIEKRNSISMFWVMKPGSPEELVLMYVYANHLGKSL